MTDNELEQQAKLWHVASRLNPEKSTELALLLGSLRHPIRIRRQALLAAVGALTLGGIGIVSREASHSRLPLASIELLEPPVSGMNLRNLPAGLALDGTVVAIVDAGTTEPKPVVWNPGKTMPMPFPAKIKRFTSRAGQQNLELLPNKALLVGEEMDGSGVLWQEGKKRMLPPLPGYDRSWAGFVTAKGIVGYSQKNTSGTDTTRLTLWRGTKPEPLDVVIPQLSSVIDANEQGDVLVRTGSLIAPYQVVHKNVLVPVEASSPELPAGMRAEPVSIGKGGALVGLGASPEGQIGVIWPTPGGRPRPLWSSFFAFGMQPIECHDIDEQGRVIGIMSNPATETTAPFLWEKGRYIDLQSCLPPQSGWVLKNPLQIKGFVIVGTGEYKGIPSLFRLTLR